MTTNSDRIFRAVIANEELVSNYCYDPAEYPSLTHGLIAENPIVQAVAKIISEQEKKTSQTAVYNELKAYLDKNLL